MLVCALVYAIAHETAGAARTGLPCALYLEEGRAASYNSGASRRENAPAYPPLTA
jgi:hypothetical protein